jgi:AraC family transcriptional regulator, transcriptional activator of the genes for pyochelin and ferripyochelin receptors
MTLERISREVRLNRMALTSGFRRLFGMSVPECLQEVRIERASELLRDGTQSIAQSSGAVGYEHSCIFRRP